MNASHDIPDLAVLPDFEGAKALHDPARRRLVEALLEEPDSASGLARRLGDTRQRLNYHLKALEEAGVLELEEERMRGNCMERVLRVAARRFIVAPLSPDGEPAQPHEVGDRFSASYMIALAARTIRELAGLQERARDQGKRLGTASLDAVVHIASPADMQAFVDDLTEAVAGVIQRHHALGDGSRPFRVFAGTYPGKDEAPPAPADQPHPFNPKEIHGPWRA